MQQLLFLSLKQISSYFDLFTIECDKTSPTFFKAVLVM